MAPVANPTVAPAAENKVAQAASIMMARAAKEKMTPRKVIDPYPKSILGKRSALHAFGCSEHFLEPLSKRSRNDDGDSYPLLLRQAEAEMIRMQQEHTATVTELQNSLRKTVQETNMYVDTIQKLEKDLQHERENVLGLRSELIGKQQGHAARTTDLQNSLQEMRQEVIMHVSTIQKLENSLQHEQENIAGLRSELSASQTNLSQKHAQLTSKQDHFQNLQNQLEAANRALTTERETNDRKSLENAALVRQIQAQQDRDMDDANFHGHLQTPEDSGLELMDESEDSMQPQKEHSNAAAQTDSEELAKLSNAVTKLRAELQHEQEKRKSAQDNERIYRRLFEKSQASLMPTQQSSEHENSETNGDFEASYDGSSTAQANVAPLETIESEVDSDDDQVLETKPLSGKDALSKPKNAMNTRSTKVERSKARIGKASLANGVNKSNKPAKNLVKQSAEQVRKSRLLAMKVEAKLKQDFRQVLENHIELSDDLYTEAREGLARGESIVSVDEGIRSSLEERFKMANVYYDNGQGDMLSWNILYPNSDYSEFRYYTKKGGENICVELLDNDLNVYEGYPLLPSYKPYYQMDMTNKAHYAQNLVFAKIPELQLAAAATVLPEHLVDDFRKRLFEGEPAVETWEQVHCKARWDDVVSTLSSMQSFRRACGYYAKGEKLDPGSFWPLNFAKAEVMSACDPEYDDPPYMPSNVGALESLFTQTFIR